MLVKQDPPCHQGFAAPARGCCITPLGRKSTFKVQHLHPQARSVYGSGINTVQTLLWLRYHSMKEFWFLQHFYGCATTTAAIYQRGASAGTLRLSNHVLQFPAACFVDHLEHEDDGYEGTGCVEPVGNRQTNELGQHGKAYADEEIGDPLRGAADRQPRAPNLIGKHLAQHHPHDRAPAQIEEYDI